MNAKFVIFLVVVFCIIQFAQADFMDEVKDVWKSSVRGVKNTFESIGDWFGDKADDAKDATSDFLDDAKSGVKDLSRDISKKIS